MLNKLIRSASRSEARGTNEAAQATVRLLHGNLSRTAWLISVVGSILNFAQSTRTADSLAQIENFLPPELPPIPALPAMPCSVTQTLVLSLDQFHGQVDVARRMTAARLAMKTSESAFDDLKFAPILATLCETWRKLALAGQLQLYQVQAALRHGDDILPVHVSQDIILQLKQVERGESPCLDRNGVVQFGGRIDRRGAPRIVINMKVSVHSHARKQDCFVTNVSRSGVGLSNVFGLSVGEEIWLRITDRVALPGQVIWVDQGYAGVQLQYELTADDWFDMPGELAASRTIALNS